MTPDPGSTAETIDAPVFEGEIFPSQEPAEADKRNRSSPRMVVAIDAALRPAGGPGVSVLVSDLSIDGFRLETKYALWQGADFWLRLPGLEARHATVKWVSGPTLGCAFERPLHPAVLALIIDKAR